MNILKVESTKLPNSCDMDERNKITLLNLSAFGFVLFPLLGPLLPFVFWVLIKNKSDNLNRNARKLINFQITWCLLFVVVLLTPLLYNVLHIPMPFLNFVYLYIINSIYLLVNLVRLLNKLDVWYKPAIPFFKN